MADAVGQGTTDLGGGFHIPTKILENNMLSETAEAYLCFTEQKFSATLQAFLLDYVISVSGIHSVYA